MKELLTELRNKVLYLRNTKELSAKGELILLHKLNALEKQFAISGVSKRYYHEVCGKGTLIKEYEHSVYGTMLMVKPLKQKDIYFAPKREFTELPFS